MGDWFKRNSKNIIIISYIIPILIASILSISHVITWYGMTNPMSWAVYLSIGIEIAALSALAGIIIKVNKYVYVPFILVTLIQFIGNVFYGYQFIDTSGQLFQNWLELTAPLFDWLNLIEPENVIAHKRLLAFLGGGLIPVISLSFLHLLVTTLNEYDKEERGSIEEDRGEESDNIPSSETDDEPFESEDDEDYEGDDDITIVDSPDSDGFELREKVLVDEDNEKGITSFSGSTSGTTLNENITGSTDPSFSASTVAEQKEKTDNTEKNEDNSDENEEKKENKDQGKKKIKKEDIPEIRKMKQRDKGSSNIQRVDDYGKKRTN